MIKAGIVGFRGYSGAELIQILHRHGGAEVFLMEHRADAGDRPGLGLGLYISSEIARAHSGTLDVTSTPAETRFTLRMPLA